MVVVSLKLTACVCRVALWSATHSRLKRRQGKRDFFFFLQKCYANIIGLGRSAEAPRPHGPAVYTIQKLTWSGKEILILNKLFQLTCPGLAGCLKITMNHTRHKAPEKMDSQYAISEAGIIYVCLYLVSLFTGIPPLFYCQSIIHKVSFSKWNLTSNPITPVSRVAWGARGWPTGRDSNVWKSSCWRGGFMGAVKREPDSPHWCNYLPESRPGSVLLRDNKTCEWHSQTSIGVWAVWVKARAEKEVGVRVKPRAWQVAHVGYSRVGWVWTSV